MELEFREYLTFVRQVESRDPVIQFIGASGMSMDAREYHAAIGMVAEAGELLDAFKRHVWYGKTLDAVNLTEELGDLSFYLAIACDTSHHNPYTKWEPKDAKIEQSDRQAWEICTKSGEYVDRDLFSRALRIQYGAMRFVTLAMAQLRSGAPFVSVADWRHEINVMRVRIHQMAQRLGATEGSIRFQNRAKLLARFPSGKFKSEQALNRNLDLERLALEEPQGASNGEG